MFAILVDEIDDVLGGIQPFYFLLKSNLKTSTQKI